MSTVFLTAQWRHLLMVNYAMTPALLQPYLPRGTELDLFHGQAFVSLVGFHFLGTRVRGVRAICYQNFPEVNLRFYVRRATPQGWRRGVVFIKEITPRTLVNWIACRVYHEKYVTLPMEAKLPQREGDAISFAWRDGRQAYLLTGVPQGRSHLPAPGSEEEFIAEHYWGYTQRRDQTTMEYEVQHPPWNLRPVRDAKLIGDVNHMYGVDFAPVLAQPPSSAFLAEGSPVSVSQGVKLVEALP